MDDSPFRRIVLPALLASGAGFAALTWPLASDHAARVSERLPDPLGRWADSALVTNQYKEFSIRYIGFAILSSVAIGIGTAEVMRSHQRRMQNHQSLLDQVLADVDLDSDSDRLLADNSSLDNPSGADSEPALAHQWGRADSDDPTTASEELDWADLLQVPFTPAEAAPVEVGLLPTPMGEHPLYHIQRADQSCCLALAVAGEYYRYYRSRSSLDKARSLVQHLRHQGQQTITTVDGSGYVVWLHQPNASASATPWTEPLAGS